MRLFEVLLCSMFPINLLNFDIILLFSDSISFENKKIEQFPKSESNTNFGSSLKIEIVLLERTNHAIELCMGGGARGGDVRGLRINF